MSGNFYFAVETYSDRIWIHADEHRIQDGTLMFLTKNQKDPYELSASFVFAPGVWKYFYAASVLDGGAVDVEHWSSSKTAIQNNKQRADTSMRSKITPTIRMAVFRRDSFKCKFCGRTSEDGVGLVVDHIVPISKGGTSSIRNLQTLCDPCNMGKGGR